MMQSYLPSPARLGLTASSPSLPPNPAPVNPTSSPPHNNLPAATGATAAPTLTTSPSLLQLLPPLPCAQSLLHLISSLASNLFELSPNRAAWISAYRGSLATFLSSASSTAPLPSPISSTKDALSLLNSLQSQLFEAVTQLQETLDLLDARARLGPLSLLNPLQSQLFEAVTQLQETLDLLDARARLGREARAKDAALLAFAKKLREAYHVLDRLVDDYADYRRDPKRPRGASASDDPELVSGGDFGASLHSRLKLDDILTYAHCISYTTFAPPEHGAGLALRGALPPAPQENEMRMSQLYQFADLDVGVPKKPLEPKERIAAAVDAMPLFEPTPPREEAPQPPSLSITLPRMPEFRKEILKPPPGWKPGDPIELLPDVVPGVKAEEPKAPVPEPHILDRPVAPTGQQPIQVKNVQLDFGSSSSDEYSSDVGSSDEDDED